MNTNFTVTHDLANIDWWRLANIMERAPLCVRKPFDLAMAFRHSYAAAFVWHGELLVGCARATSDGVYYATVVDVCVDPEYQGRGAGRLLMESLLPQLPVEKVFLTSVFGRAPFYEKFGFLRQNNAMGLYDEPARSVAIANGVLTPAKAQAKAFAGKPGAT